MELLGARVISSVILLLSAVKRCAVRRYKATDPVATEYLTHSLFYGTSLYLVQAKPGSDRRLQQYIQTSNIVTELTSAAGPSFANATADFSCDAPEKYWEPVIDSQGSFVGLYRTTDYRPGVAPQDVYYIVCTAGCGEVGHELYEVAEQMREGGESFDSFLIRPEVSYARNVATRNRGHIARAFAKALQLEIETVGDYAGSPPTNNEPAPDVSESAFGVTRETWVQMSALLEKSDFQQIGQLLEGSELSMDSADLIGLLSADPYAQDDATAKKFIKNTGVDEVFAQMGVFVSETVHNDILQRGGFVNIYSHCKSMNSLREGNGICSLLSPVEGVEMQMFDQNSDLGKGNFGGLVRSKEWEVIPTTSGRVRVSTTIDFDSVSEKKEEKFLLYPQQNGQPNDRVLDGSNAVYRPRDGQFTRHLNEIKDTGHGRECMNSVRMKPLQVIIQATPLHRLPREIADRYQEVG